MQNDSKCVIASCVSGLCNAISTLVISTIVANHLGRPLYVYWIDGFIANDVQLLDIFEISSSNKSKFLTTEEYGNVCNTTKMIRFCDPHAHELDFKNNIDPGPYLRIFHYNNLNEISEIPSIQNHDIYICEPQIPAFIKPGHLKVFFDLFLIKQENLAQVNNFISQHKCTHGIHIRGTDILSMTQYTLDDIKQFVDDMIHKIVSNGVTKGTSPVFICSDDENVENMFRDNKLIAMFEKEYVYRRDTNQSWFLHSGSEHINKSKDLEHNGKLYKSFATCNMVRSTKQVIGGWIDLLTLAHLSNIDGFITSQTSTYFAFAKLLHTFLHQNKNPKIL
jgi:hypothetical protein